MNVPHELAQVKEDFTHVHSIIPERIARKEENMFPPHLSAYMGLYVRSDSCLYRLEEKDWDKEETKFMSVLFIFPKKKKKNPLQFSCV